MKNERGSITLFTLIAMMFFLTIAFTAYASAMAKLQAQNEDLERIKASYEQDLTEEGLASLYEKLASKCVVKFIDFLPEEYQEIEYIESTGTQYIDTNYVANSKTNYEIEAQVNHDLKIDGCLFGSRTAAGTSDAIVLWHNTLYNFNEEVVSPVVAGNEKSKRYSTSDFPFRKFRYINNTFYMDDNIITQFTNKLSDSNVFHLYLMALNHNGVANGRMYRGKIKYFKIWENDTLVRDYIPCYRKSDNTIGMYDLVEEKLYTNLGTDTFKKGSEVYTEKMESQKFVYGVPQRLKLNEYTRNGYVFKGWNTKRDGTGITYDNGQEVTFGEKQGNKINLYAQWIKNQ